MTTFKRKALTSVVLGTLGAAGAAHAVYQDPNGQGQALIYPYYTVQTVNGNAYNTYISIVNSTTQAKVVKVRAREGKASAEVIDFNLYLSPNDMWTAAVLPSSSGGALMVTTDVSCTDPQFPAGGVEFRNFQYVGDPVDVNGLDRTREGYIEVIEMATIVGSAAAAATHNSAGTPTCAGLRSASVGAIPANMGPANRSVPTGGLSGTGSLINVNNGVDMGYNATALSNLTAAEIYTPVGTEQGTLQEADPIAVVISNNRVYRANFDDTLVTGGAKAVSAVFMHSAVINEYVLDTVTRSNTDWVLTFPTKHFFYPNVTPETPFTGVLGENGACENISFSVFNREEATTTAAGGDFSPLPPGAPASALCWETTVLSIRNGQAHMPTGTVSGVLGSRNTTAVNIPSTFQNGWARVTFTGTNATVSGLASNATSVSTNILTGAAVTGGQTFRGLPVLGFMVRTFTNGTLVVGGTTVLSNYGSAFDHKYEQNITPAP